MYQPRLHFKTIKVLDKGRKIDSRDNCKGYYIFTVRDAETNDLISAV